jgi:hypothetical protein
VCVPVAKHLLQRIDQRVTQLFGSAHCAVAVLTCPVTFCCRVHGLSCVLAAGAKKLGLSTVSDTFFDTVTLKVGRGTLGFRLQCSPHTVYCLGRH